MSDAPLISVIIPTYNYARFLPEAIDSVLRQSFQNFEIVLSDDASTDESDDLCKRYAAAHASIRYQRQPENLGMVFNWNWCLEQARGALIKPLMADDLLSHPETLERMARILLDQPEVSLVTCARNVIDDDSRVRTCWKPLGSSSRRIPARQWQRQHLGKHFPPVLNSIGEPTAVMFRKRQAARGFDTGLHQLVDLEMWLHLLSFGDLYVFGEPLCAFRQHAQQQTEYNRTLFRHQEEAQEIYRRYSPSPFRERHLYRIMRRMIRDREPGANAAYRRLRGQLTTWSWLALRFQYRMARICENVRHSWCKRTGGGDDA